MSATFLIFAFLLTKKKIRYYQLYTGNAIGYKSQKKQRLPHGIRCFFILNSLFGFPSIPLSESSSTRCPPCPAHVCAGSLVGKAASLQHTDAWLIERPHPGCHYRNIALQKCVPQHRLDRFDRIPVSPLLRRNSVFQFLVLRIAIHVLQRNQPNQLLVLPAHDGPRLRVILPMPQNPSALLLTLIPMNPRPPQFGIQTKLVKRLRIVFAPAAKHQALGFNLTGQFSHLTNRSVFLFLRPKQETAFFRCQRGPKSQNNYQARSANCVQAQPGELEWFKSCSLILKKSLEPSRL